ncbi:Acetoacetyl-CoA reductase [Thioalkalivibrio nitratireducens DSM 14787]|uniref:Acetoacetyl-CoA reductase n=1 Tax=Thioalkalivibrio nitratireducens (strain DSM 14787 / UNIQEM 213 / ALEN2) TaxID=1255043 RepID=L0DX45_THIND|nr:acetoacetyl-CoA reductase [Thioalkalivibrio nitratireducens]AGA32911.1 Acetoacetyl-CoA reductase [Thioalkalivibrio nitratireducens DSM 14787]
MAARTALVTGGIGGIGSAICRELAAKGFRVVAGYYPAEKDLAEQWQQKQHAEGLKFEIASGDVSSFEDSQQMVRDIETRVGPIDVLINCAGITRDKTFRKMEPDQWRAVISTNLDSLFNVTRQVVDGMMERGWGRIVNISSVNGQRGQFGQTNYSAAKAGAHGFTMALAQEVARKGVTVNTVSPGYIATEMTQAIAEEVRQQIIAQVPMARMGEPDEVAYLVGVLCDDRAGYITGANYELNGGLFMSF